MTRKRAPSVVYPEKKETMLLVIVHAQEKRNCDAKRNQLHASYVMPQTLNRGELSPWYIMTDTNERMVAHAITVWPRSKLKLSWRSTDEWVAPVVSLPSSLWASKDSVPSHIGQSLMSL